MVGSALRFASLETESATHPSEIDVNPLQERQEMRKRREVEFSAFCVNWWAGQFRDRTKSSPARARTWDTRINSPLLYQLS